MGSIFYLPSTSITDKKEKLPNKQQQPNYGDAIKMSDNTSCFISVTFTFEK